MYSKKSIFWKGLEYKIYNNSIYNSLKSSTTLKVGNSLFICNISYKKISKKTYNILNIKYDEKYNQEINALSKIKKKDREDFIARILYKSINPLICRNTGLYIKISCIALSNDNRINTNTIPIIITTLTLNISSLPFFYILIPTYIVISKKSLKSSYNTTSLFIVCLNKKIIVIDFLGKLLNCLNIESIIKRCLKNNFLKNILIHFSYTSYRNNMHVFQEYDNVYAYLNKLLSKHIINILSCYDICKLNCNIIDIYLSSLTILKNSKK